MNGLLLYYDIVSYVRWSLLFDAVQILLLQCLVYALLRAYRKTVYAR